MEYIMPCIYAFIACLGFAITYNIRWQRMIPVCFGGALGWVVYLLLKDFGDVFAYFVVENEMVKKCAKKAAELLGCELIELHYKKTPQIQGENIILDAGPKEFLTYIRDAKLVVTNSFHGTVFSILFQKKFFSVYKENGRIENLLGFLGITDCHIQSEDGVVIEKKIDYASADEKLEAYRKQSVDYLKRALEDE